MLDAEQKRLAADGLLLGRCVIRHDRPYLRLIGGPLCFTGGSRLRLCGSAGLPGAARLACDFLGRRHGSCFVRCLRPLRCVFIHPDFTAGCKAQLIRSGITHRFRFLLRRIDLPHRQRCTLQKLQHQRQAQKRHAAAMFSFHPLSPPYRVFIDFFDCTIKATHTAQRVGGFSKFSAVPQRLDDVVRSDLLAPGFRRSKVSAGSSLWL